MPVVVEHDPKWIDKAELEAGEISAVLGELLVDIQHIGSTSIPHIYAKPIIDFLLVVTSIDRLDEEQAALIKLGYEAMGEYGIPGRRYFRKADAQGVRTHHAHAFQVGHEGVHNHLVFRDYMIAHPEIAHAYGLLKKELAAKYPDDSQAYMDGKDPFIKEHLRLARRWDADRGREDANNQE